MHKNKLNLRVLDVEEMTEREMASVTGGTVFEMLGIFYAIDLLSGNRVSGAVEECVDSVLDISDCVGQLTGLDGSGPTGGEPMTLSEFWFYGP